MEIHMEMQMRNTNEKYQWKHKMRNINGNTNEKYH